MAGVRGWLGRAARLPLRLVPHGVAMPILSGPLRGGRWIAGAGTHGCWLGNYERDKQAGFAAHLRPGGVAWDLGANAGFYTLLASRLVGPAGQVRAFEPLPRNLATLRRHLAINRCGNVVVHEQAVADAVGSARFRAAADAAMGALADEGEIEVAVTTLDAVAAAADRPPDLLKIDVEGAEAAVLRGGDRLLRMVRPVVLLSGHGWRRQEECVALLADLGYRLAVTKDGAEDGIYEAIATPA